MLKSNLSKIAQLAPEAAKAALLQTAKDIYDVSQQLVPVDTGALKASGGIEVESSSKVTIGYGNDQVNYAVYQEYGTSRMAAQPFLTPAFTQAEETFKVRLQEEMEKLTSNGV